MTRFIILPALLAMAATTATAETPRQRSLTLADAIELSLANNPDLAVAGFAPRRAAAEVERQKGAFDPQLSFSLGVERERRPGLVALGTSRDAGTAEGRLAGRLVWGTEYALRYGTVRVDTDSQLAPVNPSSTAYVELAVRQPLLRDFGRDVNRAGITIAEGHRRIADAGVQRATELSVAATVDAYWRLVRAHRSLGVARDSLYLAEELVTDTEARVAAGDRPAIELTQARASVAARQEAVILGEAEVGNASDALARMLSRKGDVFDVELTPLDAPDGTLPPVEPHAMLEASLRDRPELRAAREAIRTAEVALAAARDRTLPDLSLVGSVGLGGFDGSWPSAQSDLGTDLDQHRWTAGVTLSIPIGNRAATAAEEDAQLAVDQARLELRNLELQVTQEVRAALRSLDAAGKRIEATREATALAREQLDAAEKRLAAGLSTAFEVLRLQTDLAAAQNAEVTALVSHRVGLAQLHLAAGGLRQQYGARR